MNRRIEYIRFTPVYGISDFFVTLFYEILNRGQCYGTENIPEDGPFIIAANHVSFVDPPYIGLQIHRQIAPFARKTLWKGKFCNWWLNSVGTIPVDLAGNDVSAIRKVIQALDRNRAVLLFPEGSRSADGTLQAGKAGVGLMACKTQVPILPTRIFNANLALPRHGRFKPGVPVHVAFGPLILPHEYDDPSQGKNRYQHASNKIMEAIASLHLPEETVI